MAPLVPKIHLKAIDVFYCHVQQLLTRVREAFGPCWQVMWVQRKMQVVPCYLLTSLWDLIGLQKLDSCLSYGSRQRNGLRRLMWPHPEMIQRLHDSSHLKREKENHTNVSQGSPIFYPSLFILRKTFLHCNFNLLFRMCFLEEMEALKITALNMLLTIQNTFSTHQ